MGDPAVTRQLATLMLAAALARPALATDLDAFAPASCADLGRQLAPGSETTAAFNDASHRAVEAFDAGHPAEGCPALSQALRFVERANDMLAMCAGELADGAALAVGFRDLREHIRRAGKQMGCAGQAPGS